MQTPERLFNVRVSLSPNFPVDSPTVQLMPDAEHAWLNAYSAVVGPPVGHPSLGSGWGSMKNLGTVIGDLMREFVRVPPRLRGAGPVPSVAPAPVTRVALSRPLGDPAPAPAPPGPYGYSSEAQPVLPPRGSSAATIAPAPGGTASGPPAAASAMPPVPSSFPELADKTIDELDALLSNEALFASFFSELAFVKSYRDFRMDLKARNAELAQRLLRQEEALNAKRVEVQLAHEELARVRSALGDMRAAHEQIMSQYTPDALAARLEAAQNEADSASVNLEAEFVAGRIADVAEFIRDYMALRKLAHVRQIKADRLRASVRRR